MNLEDFKAFGFPGGERHIEIPRKAIDFDNGLTARIRSSDDLMDLLLVTDYLKAWNRQPEVLYIPYFPYARQDRRTTNGSSFGLKVVAKMINDLGYKKVRVYEPHSMAVETLIENCEVYPMDVNASSFIRDHVPDGPMTLMAPDAGAVKRTSQIAEQLNVPMAVAIKKRDPSTGRLKIVDVYGNWQGRRSIVVLDDICDGGATFVQLADYLKDCTPDPLNLSLFVAHGIFSKGFDELNKHYTKIGTTDSFYQRPGLDQGIPMYSCFNH